ncbi:MAG: GNAT family N-acetyltransferase [Parvibaculum sp.]
MTPLTYAFDKLDGFSFLSRDEKAGKSRVSDGFQTGRPEILISVHDDFEPLKTVWQALERKGDGTPFQTFAWLSAWQRHIGTKQGVTPAIVVGWDSQGGALFIFPFGVERGLICNRLVWLGGEISDYHGPLLAQDFARHVSPAQFGTLWDDIRDLLPTHHMVSLGRMPERVGAQANPFMSLGGMRRHPSSAHMTMLKEDWASYYGEKRSSGSKKRDKQKRRKTEELGAVEFVSPSTAEAKLATLEALIAQKSVAFQRMGVTNFFEKPGYLDFYRSLAADPEAEGLLHLSHLDVGGIVAAASCGVSFGGRYYYVLASYDEKAEAARFGPGVIQLMELMQHATENGHTVFDFTIGDESYKEQWCEVEVPLFDYVEPNTLAGWAGLGPRVACLEAKRFIKQTPVLWNAFTRVRAALGALSAARPARA